MDFPIKFSPYQVGLYHRIQNRNSLSQSRVPNSVQTPCSFLFLLRVIQRIVLSRLCCFPFQAACWLQASKWLKSDVACFPLCGMGFRLHPKSNPITLNPVQVSSLYGNSPVCSTPTNVKCCMHIHTSCYVGLDKRWGNKMDNLFNWTGLGFFFFFFEGYF